MHESEEGKPCPAEMSSRRDIISRPATPAAPDGSSGKASNEMKMPKNDEPENIASELPHAIQSKPTSDNILQGILDTQKDILVTLQNSTTAGPNGKGLREQFLAKYKKTAEEHDNEFLERYNSDMDIVLIFSGLFSAVSTSFIVAMESNLNPNPTDTTNVLLTQLIHVALGNTTAAGNVPAWPGPTHEQVWIQTIAYASLSTSLLAAFGAVLGKQWLGYYKCSRYGRGSLEQQSKRRQAKYNGIANWYFDGVVQAFPVLIQISLFLFGVALGANMFNEERTIASVIIGMTAFGFLFYASTVVMSLLSLDCPFQTPVSTILRLVFSRCAGPLVKLREEMLWWWESAMKYIRKVGPKLRYHIKIHPRTNQPDPESGQPARKDELEDAMFTPLAIPNLHVNQFEAPLVKWLLDTSTDREVFLAGARMVPEVEWSQEDEISVTLNHVADAFMDVSIINTESSPAQWIGL